MNYLKIKLIKGNFAASYSSLEGTILYTDASGNYPNFVENTAACNVEDPRPIINQMTKTIKNLN